MSEYATNPSSASWHRVKIEGAKTNITDDIAVVSINLRWSDLRQGTASFFLSDTDAEMATQIAEAINNIVKANPRPREYDIRWSGTDVDGNGVVGAVTDTANSLDDVYDIAMAHAKGVRNLRVWLQVPNEYLLHQDRKEFER